MSTSKTRWLDEGIRMLTESGPSALRIDRIAPRVGLSKGSFHHHFDGAEGYKKELLAHFEHLATESLEKAIDSVGVGASAREVLVHLTELLSPREPGLYRPETDRAVRAWAASDADARATLACVDRARLDALEGVWRRASADEENVRLSALLPYLVFVGANSIVPSVDSDDLRGVYELLLPLAPEE
ncbi:TetR/AcrR family transcriptional regulator [Brevibacterium daeguense]|uniref:TetR/AcrR family transcriptional regulator n=1 Tax=Brevibacterium daeguense TaxID=909936 RepID=A0ABP8EHF9_9MICO|nr:TetR/AcrR family transcriptional regulator [Brevibacterium daeguense]